jgi:SAM-dependent methyltransferase
MTQKSYSKAGDHLWAADDDRNRDLYRSLLGQHGYTPKALNWNSIAAQRARFEVVHDTGISRNASVLDVGCGLADLRLFLKERGHRGSYCGIDLTPEMIAAARTRFPDDQFATANLLSLSDEALSKFESDIVIASGIFYFRRNEPGRFLQEMVKRLFYLARDCLAFNSLSTWGDRSAEPDEFRADPVETLKFCRSLTPWCILRHDYHPGDFTIILRRSRFAEAVSKR